MARLCTSAGALLGLWAFLVPQAIAQCPGVTTHNPPKMAPGYRASILATGLRSPRAIVLDTAGNLLVAQQNGGSVVRLTLKDQGNNVCVGSAKTLVSDGTTNHGIALSADGKTLFVSNVDTVTAYAYNAVAGSVGARKAVITGMPNNGGHETRELFVSKASPDILLVAVGSAGNIDTATVSKDAGRSMIKMFSIHAITSKPTNYTTGGILAWGLRNIVGIGEDPVHGGIWSVENSMDNIQLHGKDVHNDNPAEKANYHGVLSDTHNSFMGKNYGYPSCVAAWAPEYLGTSSLSVGSLFSPDGVPPAKDCSSCQKARVVFPSHTAPLDIKFIPNGSAAYIAFHGSWDRSPPDGYRVMKVKFGKDGQPVEPLTSKKAAVAVMENPDTSKCPQSCFRPVGLAFDKKNRLFVSSDATGEIFVVYGA